MKSQDLIILLKLVSLEQAKNEGDAHPGEAERLGQVVSPGELGELLAQIDLKVLDQRQLSVRRTWRRSSALFPLMERSISNNASIRRTTSIAIGESGISLLPAALRRAFSSMSAMTKNGRRHIHASAIRPFPMRSPEHTQPIRHASLTSWRNTWPAREGTQLVVGGK